MGYSDIGCYGGEIDTPNLDRLAAQGLRYTQFYNTARCCPTRASLLTGMNPHQVDIGHMAHFDDDLDGYRGDLSKQCVTIAEVLKQGGYKTYLSGKWHVCKQLLEEHGDGANWPCSRGFDRFYGITGGAASYYNPPTLTRDNKSIDTPQHSEYYFTDDISEHACEFIDDHSTSSPDEPFFLYASYTAPHWPLHAPQAVIDKYIGKYKGGWDRMRLERYNNLKSLGLIKESWDCSPRDENSFPWEDAEHKDWEDARMATYAAMIDIMDQGIGRIMQTLKDQDMFDNTLKNTFFKGG